MNPLTEGDYKAIADALDSAVEVRALMTKMKNCGDDCAELERKLDSAVSRLEAYKREFFRRGKPVKIGE